MQDPGLDNISPGPANEHYNHQTKKEPQLRYEHLGSDVQNILAHDKVTCLCLSDKILALGTELGRIHLLDYSGNEVRRLENHQKRINDLSFDKDEENLASCSEDSTVQGGG
mmetsp:Transcript_22795/g.49963  ORF Transcript_22795/g.49963 Transcript_22795/m.49963 type:complete len:111 (+) Transcript_22795:110-442(+)